MGWQQGDHQGRPYMVCLLCLKCRGDPGGRPQQHSLCKNRTRTLYKFPTSLKYHDMLQCTVLSQSVSIYRML